METECLTIVLDRITFANKQNGYHVLRASCRGHSGGITVVGNFGPIHPGEELRVHGIWTYHPQFGQQFQCFRYSTLKPATLKGIEKFLGSGLIKGIGPKTARRLVEKFGIETLEVIENDPEKMSSCPGIGPHRMQIIQAGWAQQKIVQDVMIFLQGHGISTAYAVRIFKKFGKDAIQKVTENPYHLAYEIAGIGFKTADKIAAEFDIKGEDPRRVEAGLLYVLATSFQDGHLFLTREELLKKSAEMLGVEEQLVLEQGIDAQLTRNRLLLRPWQDQQLIYLPVAFRDEEDAVRNLGRFLSAHSPPARERILAAIEHVAAQDGVCLSEEQACAVERSLRHRFMILTGGPGTGKTTTLRALVGAHSALNRRVLLASPTGRAAKRLAEVTGMAAVTVHRLLDFSPQDGKFRHDRSNPLSCQTLVIDEASMLDMGLFAAVLRAVPDNATIILVGDADQLPSVGPGLVLRHLIESECVVVERLARIFRQAEESLIVRNAHLVNRGKMPILVEPDGKTRTDCYFLASDDLEKCAALLQNVVLSSLPKRFNYHPIEEIQVLVPMNRGTLGAHSLNRELQKVLNPPHPEKAEIAHNGRVFRVGDKVIQLRNNYDLEVFNGDVGFVRTADPENQEVGIEFPQGNIIFQPHDLLDVGLAYAITVHKAQGSEYPAVVLVLTTQHYMMLQRKLLYTGLTRARKTMVLLGMKKALGLAVRNDNVKSRNSMLRDLLKQTYMQQL